MAFSVAPSGPTRRDRRLTNLSLFRTMPPILMMSHSTPSSSIFSACSTGMLRDSSLMASRAFKMMYGSTTFRVVLTVMDPSTKFSSAFTPCACGRRVGAQKRERNAGAKFPASIPTHVHGLRHNGPHLLQVLLPIRREERRERTLLHKWCWHVLCLPLLHVFTGSAVQSQRTQRHTAHEAPTSIFQ